MKKLDLKSMVFCLFASLVIAPFAFSEDSNRHKDEHKHQEKSEVSSDDDHGHKHDENEHSKKKENHRDHDDDDHDDDKGHSSHTEDEGAHHGGDHKESSHSNNGHDKEHGHDDHEEESSKFGPDRAIAKVKNEGESFKLSNEAIEALRVGAKLFSRVNGNHEVPRKALVTYQDKVGIFILKNEWFQLVPVVVVENKKDSVVVRSNDLRDSVNVVVEGVPLVRVAHLEASGQGGQGHAH